MTSVGSLGKFWGPGPSGIDHRNPTQADSFLLASTRLKTKPNSTVLKGIFSRVLSASQCRLNRLKLENFSKYTLGKNLKKGTENRGKYRKFEKPYTESRLLRIKEEIGHIYNLGLNRRPSF